MYFDAPSFLELTGYYVQHHVPAKLPLGIKYHGPLYVKIANRPVDSHTYLFKGQGKWIIGDQFGEEHGVAFVSDNAATPFDMRHDSWMFSGGT